MKNTILATTAVILIISAFSCFAPETKLRQTVKPDKTVKILNLSGEIGLDTITSIGVTELGLEDLKIIIVTLTQKEIEEDETLLGYISQEDSYYLIRLKPGLYKDYYLEIISHELTHLNQYYTGRLKVLSYGIQYDNLTYSFEYPYWDRQWEIIAFQNEDFLKIAIQHKMNNPVP